MIHDLALSQNKLHLLLIHHKSAEKKTHSALVVPIKAPHLSDLPNVTAAYLPEVSAACPGAPFINIPVFCGGPANAAQHDKTALACHLTRPQTVLYNWLVLIPPHAATVELKTSHKCLVLLLVWRISGLCGCFDSEEAFKCFSWNYNLNWTVWCFQLRFLYRPLDGASRNTQKYASKNYLVG